MHGPVCLCFFFLQHFLLSKADVGMNSCSVKVALKVPLELRHSFPSVICGVVT